CDFAQLRGAVRGRDRVQGKIRAPVAGAAGGADQRREGQSRVLSDAGDAGAAHPTGEGDVEYLHKPGADRVDGYGVYDRLWEAGATGVSGAESGKGTLFGG